jgi:2-methylcitrate dehydratase PrpD
VSVLAELAERVHQAAIGASEETLTAAGRHALDTTACVVSGGTHPLAGRWLPLVPEVRSSGELAIGAPGPRSLETAVEIDATLAHLDEFDPLHTRAGVAPGAVVVPPALLVGAARGASGAAVARAILAGYEALVEAALRFGGARLYEAGWWPTALFGALGSAAAVAELLGLDQRARTVALALATSQLGGLLSGDELGHGHYLLCGTAARRGTWAAFAAQAGLTASGSLLDGPAAAALGRDPLPASDHDCHLLCTGLKSWPCARPLHTALAALDDLAAAGAVPVPGDTVGLALPTPLLRFVTAARQPAGAAAAAASAAVAVAGSAVGRARDPGWYRDIGQGRSPLPDITVELTAVPSLDAEFPARWGAEVTLRPRHGSIVKARSLVAPGEPERPLPTDTLIAKASQLLRIDPEAPVLHRLLALSGEPDISRLRTDLLTAMPGSRP